MNPSAVESLFDELLQAPDATRMLRRIRRDTPDLFPEVASLYEAFQGSGGFLEEPADVALLSTELASPHQVPPTLAIGEEVVGHRILTLLGRGATAHVYRALDMELQRDVAIKVSWLSQHSTGEGRTLAQLPHDHIVQVYGQHDIRERNLRLVVMQYIDGETLEDRLQGDPPADVDAYVCGLATALGSALAFAHSRDVLHLDIKPANILLDSAGRPYLSDFNVSRCGDDAGLIGGTPKYMSPEQQGVMSGQMSLSELDERADIYSLCRTLGEVRGRFAGGSASVEVAIDRGADPDRDARYRDARVLTATFEAALEIEAVQPKEQRSVSRWGILLAVTLPQVVGSVINIAYNQTQIVGALGAEGAARFHSLVLLYNVLVYPLGIAALFAILRPLFRRVSREAPALQPSESRAIRRQALTAAKKMVWLSSFCWLPGALFFPLALGAEAHHYGHFAISFGLSWLIAATYSFFLIADVLVHRLYPLQLVPYPGVMREVRGEMEPLLRWVQVFQVLATVIPLLGALLLLGFKPGEDIGTMKWLLFALVCGGILGSTYVGRAGDRLRSTMAALAQPGA